MKSVNVIEAVPRLARPLPDCSLAVCSLIVDMHFHICYSPRLMSVLVNLYVFVPSLG